MPSVHPTRLVDRIEYRTDLSSVLGIWIDAFKTADQRDKFGTQCVLKFCSLPTQLLRFRRVLLVVYLITQPYNFTIGLGLELVATNDLGDILRVCLQLQGIPPDYPLRI
jgi:hypothetical protein